MENMTRFHTIATGHHRNHFTRQQQDDDWRCPSRSKMGSTLLFRTSPATIFAIRSNSGSIPTPVLALVST
jgi:hypothetical protein